MIPQRQRELAGGSGRPDMHQGQSCRGGCAEALAKGILAAAPADASLRPTILYRRVCGRMPTESEVRLVTEAVRDLEEALAADGVAAGERMLRAWTAVAQALLAGNEFLFVR